MKKIFTAILSIVPLLACAQGWKYSERFRTDVWTGYVDRDIEVVDCSTGPHEIRPMYQCFRQDAASGLSYGYMIKSQKTNINGLTDKVARGVAAARPKRSSSSYYSSGRRSSYSTGRAGTSYNHATSQSHIDWVHQKQAERQEAIRRAQEKKRREEIRRRIEDDNRAAAVTAATNARLQGETNRRIQKDYYNANEGAYQAQQRARQAHKIVGPQFQRKKTSNAERAKMLRGQNKPRRIMYPRRQPQNVARKQLAQVERKQLSPQQQKMLKRALMVRAELRRKNAAERKWAEYKGIKLSDGAVSTLGKDWNSEGLTTGPLAPPPTTRVSVKTKYEEPKWLTDIKNMRKMLGAPPLTSHEELQLFVEREIYPTL